MTLTPLPALSALRADVQGLSPTAARTCCIYLPSLLLPDTWMSALLVDLNNRAAGAPWPDVDTLISELGRPGDWLGAACHGDGLEARLWLTAAQVIADDHAPKLPPPD